MKYLYVKYLHVNCRYVNYLQVQYLLHEQYVLKYNTNTHTHSGWIELYGDQAVTSFNTSYLALPPNILVREQTKQYHLMFIGPCIIVIAEE